MDAGYDALREAIIDQTKKAYMRSVKGGCAERRIERDIRSRWWQLVILEGIVSPKAVIIAWRKEKNSQY